MDRRVQELQKRPNKEVTLASRHIEGHTAPITDIKSLLSLKGAKRHTDVHVTVDDDEDEYGHSIPLLTVRGTRKATDKEWLSELTLLRCQKEMAYKMHKNQQRYYEEEYHKDMQVIEDLIKQLSKRGKSDGRRK